MRFKSTKYFIENNLDYSLDSFEKIPKEIVEHDLNSMGDELKGLFNEIKPNNWNTLCWVYDNKDGLLWKKFLLLDMIKTEESKLFIKCLLETNNPYDDEDLVGLNVDSKGLVDLREFIRFKINNKIKDKYCICSPIRNSDVLDKVRFSFLYLKNIPDAEIKIRLDPLIKYPNISCDFEKISGKILNWDELCDVEEDVPVLCENFDTTVKTQIYWQRREDEFHFHCEELPAYDEITKRGSRYYHAIYNTRTKKIIHFDASTKIYTEEEFLKRIELKLWDNNCKRFKKYFKIYKANGEFDTEIFTMMITSFFDGNDDIKEYFEELSVGL